MKVSPLWNDLFDGYDRWLETCGKSFSTRKRYRKQLARIGRQFPDGPETVTLEGLTAWLEIQPWANNTIISYRSAFRGFFTWLRESNQIDDNPAAGLRPEPQNGPITRVWAETLEAYDRWLVVGYKTPATREGRRYQLLRLARQFPDGPASVTLDGLVDWLSAQAWGADMLRSHRTAIQGFYAWAMRTRRVEEEPLGGVAFGAAPAAGAPPCARSRVAGRLCPM